MLPRNPHRATRRRAAFTLMEVLLVMAILLILGSIVVVSFSGIFGGAEEDKTKIQLNLVAEAVKLYRFQCRVPPTSINDLLVQPAGLEGKWRGPYLDDVPKDGWEQELTITDNGDGSFTVSSPGAPNAQRPITVTKKY